MKFTEFKLSETILKGLESAKFVEATEIQAKVIPPFLEGRSIVGQAKTGSGKTLAFGIPIIERIDPNLRKIQAVIITPTRELAKQIADELSIAAKLTRLKIITIYGGMSFERQVDLIQKGAQIIAATPGRLLDHLRHGLIIKPKIIVLDEADKMFDMGFFEDVNYILKLLQTHAPQQFGFFGATIPDETVSLAQRYMQDPVIITIRQRHEEKIPKTIDQSYYITAESGDKLNFLIKIIDDLKESHNGNKNSLKILVFVKTRSDSRALAETLNQMGYNANCINSDMRQVAREMALEDFKKYKMLLIATDVVSRGIDIDDVTHVINFDVPSKIEDYLHRVGRTGRMEKEGCAITLATPEELVLIDEIEQKYNITIKKKYLQRGQRGRGLNY